MLTNEENVSIMNEFGGVSGVTVAAALPEPISTVINMGQGPVWISRLWMPIDDDTPLGEPLLLGWRETWPDDVWRSEVGVRGVDRAQGSSWRHGQATHWMPLPPAPGVGS